MLRLTRSRASKLLTVALLVQCLLISSWILPGHAQSYRHAHTHPAAEGKSLAEGVLDRVSFPNANDSASALIWNKNTEDELNLDLDSLEADGDDSDEEDDPFFRDGGEDGGTQLGQDDESEDEIKFDLDTETETEKQQSGSGSAGWLPRIYGMLRNTFSFGRGQQSQAAIGTDTDAEEDEDFYDDDEKADEVILDYNNLDETSEEKKFLAGDKRGFHGLPNPSFNNTNTDVSEVDPTQARQFFPMPMYMMQGIYLVEPRLNHYIDGVLRNLGSEIKVSGNDPLYYRVMPKGRVASRISPPRKGVQGAQGVKSGKRRRRKQGNRNRNRNRRNRNRNRNRRNRNRNRRRRRRRRPFFGRSWGGGGGVRRRRRGGNANRRRKPGGAAKSKAGGNRIAGKNVGLGRVDGLSSLVRDGPTEMQSQTADGNYTLVRSHFNMGPLDMSMQFRTVRGIKRAATTVHHIKIHTVTRVSNDGSEMMDFYLDRPHPETIKVRGKLFPLAERVARNIFSRLFSSDSFLVARIREKTSMALLSKPTTASPG